MSFSATQPEHLTARLPKGQVGFPSFARFFSRCKPITFLGPKCRENIGLYLVNTKQYLRGHVVVEVGDLLEHHPVAVVSLTLRRNLFEVGAISQCSTIVSS